MKTDSFSVFCGLISHVQFTHYDKWRYNGSCSALCHDVETPSHSFSSRGRWPGIVFLCIMTVCSTAWNCFTNMTKTEAQMTNGWIRTMDRVYCTEWSLSRLQPNVSSSKSTWQTISSNVLSQTKWNTLLCLSVEPPPHFKGIVHWKILIHSVSTHHYAVFESTKHFRSLRGKHCCS